MSLLEPIKNKDIGQLKTELNYKPSQDELDACLQEAINGFNDAVEVLLKDGRANPSAVELF